MARTWLIGALINLVGSIMINLGTNVMKLGHNKRAAVELRTGHTITIRIFREWQIGVVFFVLGNLANFISFGYAAQSLLAALGSVQFVSNVAFASLVLKEKVTATILCATGCIVAGCVMLVLFGSHASKQFTVDEMMHLYTKPAYIAYLIFLGSVVVVMYAIYKRGKKKMLSVGMTGLNRYWYRVLPVSYAMFSGMIGTQSVLFSKTLSTLLRVSLGGNSQLESWFTWVIIFLFLLTSSFWISRLNKALKFFPAMIIVPTMQISWTFFSIISGMLYFQEYRDFELKNGIMFTLAVMIVFFGVFLLTKMRAIEQRLSSRLSDHSEDEKQRSHLETDEHQTAPMFVNALVKSRDVSWDDVEDVRSPIVKRDHLDAPASVPSAQTNNIGYGDIHPQLNRPSSPEDGDRTTVRPECPSCMTGSLLNNVVEDFSLDVWSSIKGTVGMGSSAAPAVTLFGPPGTPSLAETLTVVGAVLGVGLEKGATRIRLTVDCTSPLSDTRVEGVASEQLPIVHLANEAPNSFIA